MMTTKLKRAFRDARTLPAENQDLIAEIVMEAIYLDSEEEMRWTRLFESDESQSLLERMVKEVDIEIAEGRTLDFDPSGK